MNFKATVSKEGDISDYINKPFYNKSSINEDAEVIGIISDAVENENGFELTISVNAESFQNLLPNQTKRMTMEIKEASGHE